MHSRKDRRPHTMQAGVAGIHQATLRCRKHTAGTGRRGQEPASLPDPGRGPGRQGTPPRGETVLMPGGGRRGTIRGPRGGPPDSWLSRNDSLARVMPRSLRSISRTLTSTGTLSPVRDMASSLRVVSTTCFSPVSRYLRRVLLQRAGRAADANISHRIIECHHLLIVCNAVCVLRQASGSELPTHHLIVTNSGTHTVLGNPCCGDPRRGPKEGEGGAEGGAAGNRGAPTSRHLARCNGCF
eukprot:gene58-biopygen7543